LRSARREEGAAASQARDAKEERDRLSKVVDDLEDKLSTARSELADAETAASEAKNDAETAEAQAKRHVESAREASRAAIEKARLELSALESSLRAHQTEEKRNVDRRTKAETDLKARYSAEVDKVKTRIAELVQRKEAKVESIAALLREKKEESTGLAASIDEARKLL